MGASSTTRATLGESDERFKQGVNYTSNTRSAELDISDQRHGLNVIEENSKHHQAIIAQWLQDHGSKD